MVIDMDAASFHVVSVMFDHSLLSIVPKLIIPLTFNRQDISSLLPSPTVPHCYDMRNRVRFRVLIVTPPWKRSEFPGVSEVRTLSLEESALKVLWTLCWVWVFAREFYAEAKHPEFHVIAYGLGRGVSQTLYFGSFFEGGIRVSTDITQRGHSLAVNGNSWVSAGESEEVRLLSREAPGGGCFCRWDFLE